jgi:hypothetical protein
MTDANSPWLATYLHSPIRRLESMDRVSVRIDVWGNVADLIAIDLAFEMVNALMPSHMHAAVYQLPGGHIGET